MKKNLISFICLIVNLTLAAQQLSPYIINAGGNTITNGKSSLTFSVGEVATTTISNSNNTLRQGFLQPSYRHDDISCIPMNVPLDSLTTNTLVSASGACYPNLGCVSNASNITYRWVQTTSAGDIHLKVAADTSANIDFAVWGPFSDASNACLYLDICKMNIGAPLICDVNPANGGDINILNVSAQRYYLIGIVNTANKKNTVSITPMSNNTVQFNCGMFRCISTTTTACSNNSYEVFGEVVLTGAYTPNSPIFISSSDGFATSFQTPLDQSYTYRFKGLTADGAAKKIIVNTLDAQNSKIESNYTAPASCTQTVDLRALINPNFDYNSPYEAGYTNGSLNISDMGSAVYSIPLILPSGTGGVQPTLTLAYNSSTPNNIMGPGWALEGLSAITRTGNNDDVDGWTYSVSFNRKRPSNIYPLNNIVDKLALDGEKLIQTNLNNGVSEYLKGGNEYKTYNNTFNKVLSIEDTLNGPKKFKVWTKSGLIYEYGFTPDSRIETSREGASGLLPNTEGVITWLINKITDTKGNYMTFEYQKNQSGYYIKKINYTGNENAGLTPQYFVVFDFIERTDKQSSYRDGRKQENNKILKKISVLNSSDTVRSYTMSYLVSGLNPVSRLTQIQECGIGGKCLMPTQFTWEEEKPFGFEPIKNDILSRAAAASEEDFIQNGDFNGDGLGDFAIVNTTNDYIKFYQNQGNLKFELVQTLSISNLFSDNLWLTDGNRNQTAPFISLQDTRVYFEDMDGDNATDIFVVDHKNGYNLIVNSNPNVFNRTSFNFNPSPVKTYKDLKAHDKPSFSSTGLNSPDVIGIDFVDLDGNGIPEIFTFKKTTGENAFFVRETSGAKIEYRKSSGEPFPNADLINKDFQFVDVNGDGRPEIIYPFTTSNTYGLEVLHMLDEINFYNSPTDAVVGSIIKTKWLEIQGTPSEHILQQYSFADLNGDGLADIQYRYPITTDQIRLDCYTNKFSLGDVSVPLSLPEKSITFTNNDVPIVQDFSLDGKADYIVYNKTTGKNIWYLNQGEYVFDLFKSNPIDADKIKDNPFSVSAYHPESFSDVFWMKFGADQAYLSQNAGRPNFLWRNTYVPSLRILKIVDGFGTTINIKYAPLTDKTVYKSYVTDISFLNFSIPLVDSLKNNNSITTLDYIYKANNISPFEFTGRMYVVSNYEIENALGSTSRVKYDYEMAVVSRSGAGFRGFGRTIIRDLISGLNTYRTYELDQYGAMRLNSVATEMNSVGLSLSTNIDDSKYLDYTANYNNNQVNKYKVFYSYTKQAIALSYDTDGNLVSTIITKNEVDDFGNTTMTEIDYGDGHKDRSSSTYTNDVNKWYLGRLTNTLVTRTSPGNLTVTRESSFEYDPVSGFLSKEITEPNASQTTLRSEKTYEYDVFGNTTKTTIRFYNGANLIVRNVYNTFDATGRFNISTSNDLNQVTSSTYDSKTGHPISKTDVNGLTAFYEYDAFGRETKVTMPDGNWKKTEYFKCGSTGCPDAAVFYTKESNSLTPYIGKSYFDKFGREVLSEDPGWNGQTVIIENRYNYKGLVIATSDPHFVNEPTRWTTVLYDQLNREIARIDAGDAVDKTEYKGLEMTKINSLGQKKIVEYTANGRAKKVTDEQGNLLTYNYDGQGNIISVSYPGGHSITYTYDLLNRRISSTDPDMGTYLYEYNAGGEMIKQTDPKGNQVTLVYDILGRLSRRNDPEDYTLYTYDAGVKAIGKLSSKVQRLTGTTSGYITQQNYTYDALGRPLTTTTNFSNDTATYVNSMQYDALGRIEYINAPGNNGALASVKYEYNTTNHLYKVSNKSSGKTYWELTNLDSKGKVTEYKLSDGKVTTNLSYDANLDFLTEINSKNANNQTVQHLSYDYNTLGHPIQRKDVLHNMTENFTYDNLNRLLSAEVVGKQTLSMTYDVLGNIKTKSDVGTYFYAENGKGPHVLTHIELNGSQCVPSALANYTYTSFNKVKEMSKGKDKLIIEYDDSKQRFRQTTYYNNTLVKTKLFISGGLERDITPTNTKDVYYISAPIGVVAIENFNSADTIPDKTEYWLKDNLGSLQTVVTELGTIAQILSFDPWGKRRNIDGSPMDTSILGNPSVYDRGFTGHEHLDIFDLINMNGRVYDPMLGRFISADPIIEDMTNIQAFNRYTYVLNNPLSLIDPTGRVSKRSKKGFIF